MIVNGKSRSSISFWTKHLKNDKKNDRAELKEIRGLAAIELRDGLIEMQEIAAHTRCTQFMYQANFNPTADERLTEDQWQRTFEIFEKHRGIPEGQARIVYEHEKEGRVHRHVIWSRIDLDKIKAWSDSLDAKICHAASREISEELGLTRSISPFDKDREGPRPERAPEAYEMFRGLKSGLDPRDVKAEVTGIFRESEHAAEFALRLHAHGYQLVQGDRRDFCVLDPAGDVHSLARRLDGVNTKQLRGFMEGFDREALPTPEQAKAKLQEVRQAERLADLATVEREIQWEEALALSAIEKEKREKRFETTSSLHVDRAVGREAEGVKRDPADQQELPNKDRFKQVAQETNSRKEIPPVETPEPERATSPQWHFDDAARATLKGKRILPTPEKLQGASAAIWEAYNSRTWVRAKDDVEIQVPVRDPADFQQSLQEKGIMLAAVTKEEALTSEQEAQNARGKGRYVPIYRENEVVAVSERGHVYKLSMYNTGHATKEIEKFLKPLDRSGLVGIGDTKDQIQERTVEIQAFRDLLRDTNEEKRFIKATTPKGKATIRPIREATKLAGRVFSSASKGSSILGGVFDPASRLADGLLGIFDPVLTPEQKADAKLATKERQVDAEERVRIDDYTANQTLSRQREVDRERDHGRDR